MANDFTDLTGRVFGKLTVIGFAGYNRDKQCREWKVRCECGVEKNVLAHNIRSRSTTSCGCAYADTTRTKWFRAMVEKYPIGFKKHSLTVLEHIYQIGGTVLRCKCDCGKEHLVRAEKYKQAKRCSKNCHITIDRDLNYWYHTYERSCRKRKQRKTPCPFNLTRPQFDALVLANCTYCGKEPTERRRRQGAYGQNWRHFKLNGIDRKDNSIGYEPDNCCTCCPECNEVKWGMDYDKWLNWLNRMSAFWCQKGH